VRAANGRLTINGGALDFGRFGKVPA